MKKIFLTLGLIISLITFSAYRWVGLNTLTTNAVIRNQLAIGDTVWLGAGVNNDTSSYAMFVENDSLKFKDFGNDITFVLGDFSGVRDTSYLVLTDSIISVLEIYGFYLSTDSVYISKGKFDSLSLNDSTVTSITTGDTLLTKEYADTAYAETVYTFENGLTESSGVVKLGGEFDENITIYGTGKKWYLQVFDQDSYEGSLYIDTNRILLYKGDDNYEVYIEMTDSTNKFSTQDNTETSELIQNSKGLRFSQDYSNRWITQSDSDRYIPDYGLVKQIVGDSLAAVHDSISALYDSTALYIHYSDTGLIVTETQLSDSLALKADIVDTSLWSQTLNVITPKTVTKAEVDSIDVSVFELPNWKFYIDNDTLKTAFWNGATWVLIKKEYE